jgi:hypothetical protein
LIYKDDSSGPELAYQLREEVGCVEGVFFGPWKCIMSRHHMLPPIIYTPPPKPQKVEKKRRPSVDMLGELDEAAEANETTVAGPAAPVGLTVPLTDKAEIEGPASKPQGPAGRLSHDTLTALLRAQELKD